MDESFQFRTALNHRGETARKHLHYFRLLQLSKKKIHIHQQNEIERCWWRPSPIPLPLHSPLSLILDYFSSYLRVWQRGPLTSRTFYGSQVGGWEDAAIIRWFYLVLSLFRAGGVPSLRRLLSAVAATRVQPGVMLFISESARARGRVVLVCHTYIYTPTHAARWLSEQTFVFIQYGICWSTSQRPYKLSYVQTHTRTLCVYQSV